MTIRAGSHGVIFTVNVNEDVSTYTTKQFLVRDPRGTYRTWVAGFVNTGSTGGLRYTSVAGDLPRRGTYRLRAVVEKTAPATRRLTGDLTFDAE